MKHTLTSLALSLSLLIPSAVLAQKSDDVAFPSDSDVKLVVTQARRAMEQYELAVQLEEQVLSGKNAKEAVDKDKEVLHGLKLLIDAMDKHPDKFNSVLGFDFVTTLDDASRNAHVCATAALAFANSSTIEKDYSTARTLMSLSNSCSNSGVLLYTVSESVSALYVKYLTSMEKLTETATDYLTKCQEALKKASTKKN